MINLVFITDNNYVTPVAISVTSIITNKMPETDLNINILTNNVSADNVTLLKSLADKQVQIKIINVSDKISQFKNIIQGRHVPYTALLKFYIPEIFNNLDKILYFDSDVIIQTDLNEFYNHNIDDYYTECVLDIQTYNKKHLKEINYPHEKYFNSGVLLLNLSKMRLNKITEKLIKHKLATNVYDFMDQDTLNVILGSKSKFISYKYNFLPILLRRYDFDQLNEFFDEKLPQDEESLYKSCYILHLGGKEKPWTYDIKYLSEIYRKYWKLSPVKEPFPVLKQMSYEKVIVRYKFWEKIFSIKTDRTFMYKVLTICGIKMRFKRKYRGANRKLLLK